MGDILAPVTSQAKPNPNENISTADGESGNYTSGVVSAARIIQRMWRTRYPKVQKRREFFKSPRGEAILYIGGIRKAILDGALLDQREMIWRTGVLFSDGLDVCLYTKTIERLYLESKEHVKTQIDNADTSQMELFQLQWEKVLALRDRVSESAGFLSKKNWKELDIPAQDLSRTCREVLEILKGIELDLKMIDYAAREAAAAETIQHMWRTRSRILQKRREFFKTPSGEAISYIRRIYKAVLEEAPLDRNDRIRRAAVLFSDGLDLYKSVTSIEKLYLTVKYTVKSRVSGALSTEVDLARRQWEEVSKIRHWVRKNAGFLSEKNWKELDIPAPELRRKCSETLMFLEGIEADLGDIKGDELSREDFLTWC